MGLLTLIDFQDELAHMLPAIGPSTKRGTKRLSRIINMGYFELARNVEFHDLISTQTINTVDGTRTYAEATALQRVKSVIDETNTTNLRRVSLENILRMDPANKGIPERWARGGGNFYLDPVPDAVYVIKVYHSISPTVLAVDTDTTVLDSVWDQAILLLAAKIGSTIDRDLEAAAGFLNVARTYISTLPKDDELDHSSQSVGVTVAWNEHQLTDLENRDKVTT